MTWRDLPILGICGPSGCGKTTLLVEAVPHLRRRGLLVAVVKHTHHVEADTPGKDSDRLFDAGADVTLQGPAEELSRRHDGHRHPYDRVVELAGRYDLVLVEGHKAAPWPKLWLPGPDGQPPPSDAAGVLGVATWPPRTEPAVSMIQQFLDAQWLRTPVLGVVLVGGDSRRMGRPKHLIAANGQTWLERTVGLLRPVCARVVISGRGELPAALKDMTRLPDVAGAAGPAAGLLAAMRWAPDSSLLAVACDLPHLSREALDWLLAERRPGVWATLPRLREAPAAAGAEGSVPPVEPLLAHYDPRARRLLERRVAAGEFSLQLLAGDPKAACPQVPPSLRGAWRNVNDESGLG